MKVIFFLPYPIETASTRQRVFQFFPYLEENNIRCYASSFITSDFHKIVYEPRGLLQKLAFTMKGISRRISNIHDLSKFDVAFIQKEAFPFGTTIIEKLISLKKPIVYDFDDAVYIPNPAAVSFIRFIKRPSKVATIIRLSECVIAGNRFLADYAAKYSSNVQIIPTSIDTDRYTPEHKSEKRKRIVIGWIGSQSTIAYLRIVKNALANLIRKYNVIIKIVANAKVDLGIETQFKVWRLSEELNDLRSFDIGLMPLPDNEWTRSKCGYKIIQYMAVGKPVVASPVGVNKEIIDDGVNGFLAKNEIEWEDRLASLVENHSLRRKFSVTGRKSIEERYSLRTNAPKLRDLLLEVLR